MIPIERVNRIAGGSMEQVKIRKVSIDDITGLSELFVEFIGTQSNLITMKKQIEVISNDSKYYVAVACVGNKVIGTSMGIICYDLVGSCNPFMLVENVVVSQEYQGRGIGKLLMQALEEFGQKNQCNYAILVSGGNRESAHNFYEALGYSTDSRGFKKRFVKQM
jgi:GNAT superfamily N-acetyltransferase